MRKFLRGFSSLFAILLFSVIGSAADWPATLYMIQSNFISTGRVAANVSDGVYEFDITYPYSNTTAPRYYVFSSASTATNARKGTYKIFGASAITDGTSVQPKDGVAYPLADISTADDADALIGDGKISSFVPVYCYGASFKVVVDLNTMQVTFRRDPAEDDAVMLGMFNRDTSKPLARTEVVDGKACYSIKLTEDKTVYFAANAETRATTNIVPIWGATTQIDPQNVIVAAGNSYRLLRTTYCQVYTNSTCSFTIPAGAYDIVADINAGTIEFTEFTGRYRAKPATLYMRNNTFGTRYDEASNDNGVYTFTFDKSTSYTTAPFYLVFTNATSLTTARNADWVLGSATPDGNIVPEFGKKYPLADINPDKASTDAVGTFMPLYPQAYKVVVDLNDMSVVFKSTEESDPLTTLYMLDSAFKQAGVANAGNDGKFGYSYRGGKGTKVYFSTSPDRVSMQLPGSRNFGAGGHASPVDMIVEVGKSYDALPTTYRRVYTDKTGFFVLPGRCDIEFDPVTYELKILPYTGKYLRYPETLYIKQTSFSSTNYAEATGTDGVYKFEYTTQSATSSPRHIIFTDALKYASVSPMSWVLAASTDGSVVQPAPGDITPIYDGDAATIYNEANNCFIPFSPYTYNIIVDLKNYTVTWGEAVEEPASLNLADDQLRVNAVADGNPAGVYTFETTTYSSHPLFITDAKTMSELRNTAWIYYSTSVDEIDNADISDGKTGKAWRGTYYQYMYRGTGYWISPVGCNKVKARLDSRNNIIDWSVTPITPESPEVLYLVDDGMNVLSRCVSDDSGIFDFEINLRSWNNVAFTNARSDIETGNRYFYGSCVPYVASRVSAKSGVEYPVVLTSQQGVAAGETAFYLSAGKWRIRYDMNTGKAVFTDITRGGVWYIPSALVMCDDDLNVIATGETVEDGIFTFTNVSVASKGPIVKVLFNDISGGGSLFGANATGETGPKVVSGTTYDLYMPDRFQVTNDGASCFGLIPSVYDITVDFNQKKVTFVDPTIPIYPDKMSIVTMVETEPQTLATVVGDGSYIFALRNDTPVVILFTDPANGERYGAADTDPAVKNGAMVEIVKSETPMTITVPEGLWHVTLDLARMTVTFVEQPRMRFVSTTMPSGSIFNSYFGAGTQSKAVFKFTNNIKSIAGVWVVIGDYAGGVPAAGETTVLGAREATLTDNMLTVDFTGQRYELPEGAEPKVHIVLSTVVDKNDEKLLTDELEGLPVGSMVFEYPFAEFERIAIDGRFDVESGGNIDDIENMILSISHFDLLKFNDVVFSYPVVNAETAQAHAEEDDTGDDSEVPVDNEMVKVSAHWVAGETGADGYTPVNIEIPMAVRGHGMVDVSLDGLYIDDGYNDHAGDVTGSFVSNDDPTVIVTSDPTDGGVVGEISSVKLTWNHPLIHSVGNLADNAVITGSGLATPVEAVYSYPIGDDRSLVITPASPIREDGVYTLEIPRDNLVFNDRRNDRNNPIILTFAVDTTLGVATVIIDSDDDDVEIVNLAGMIVRRGKGRAALDGLDGIYIVNGVKCRL